MFPERIVCLSAESAEICARLGAGDRLVAVSAYAAPEVRAGRRVVSGFSTWKPGDLRTLQPDLVITFSDVQADIAAALIRGHVTVLATNQRTLREIADTIRLIGRAIGCPADGEALAQDFTRQLEALRFAPPRRPRVFFEEWDDPPIAGIGWVSEAIALAGGDDIFAGAGGKASRERQVDPAAVLAADPEILFASWCGKPVDLSAIAARPGWSAIRAVRDREIHPLASEDILQPGPRVLTGIAQMRQIVERWAAAALKAPRVG